MSDFWRSDTARIVKMMKATGNAPGLIQRWKNMVEAWAACNPGADAEAIKVWLPAWQARPFYSAAELAPLFPVLAVTLGLRDRPAPAKGAALLANELRWAGLPHFQCGEEIYFVVEQCHRAEEFANGAL